MLEKDPRSGQLQRAMNVIEQKGCGAIVLIRETGSSSLEEQINKRGQILSQKTDSTLRDYGIGAQILRDLGISDVILLTNSKSSLVGLEGFGVSIVDRQAIPSPVAGN